MGQSRCWLISVAIRIDDPLDATDFGKATSEGGLLGEFGEVTEKAEIAGVEGGLQVFEEEPTEEPRQHAHRQEEPWPASDPACAPGLPQGRLERQAAADNHNPQTGDLCRKHSFPRQRVSSIPYMDTKCKPFGT